MPQGKKRARAAGAAAPFLRGARIGAGRSRAYSRLPVLTVPLVLWGLGAFAQAGPPRAEKTAASPPHAERGAADRSPHAAQSVPPALVETQRAFQQVIARLSPAVVGIRVERRQTSTLANGEREERWLTVNGSGTLIRADGQILTNEHVIQAAERIRVVLADGRSADARVIGADPRSDLAVIQIPFSELPVATLGADAGVQRGQWALALGNPFGLGSDGTLSASVGIVSNLSRRLPGLGETDDRLYQDMIQTTATINPGNSGGPLFNIHGEVIGVVTAMHTRSSAEEGAGFAIPLSAARRRLIARLQSGETIEYGTLGLSAAALDEMGESGVEIVALERGGSAERAGLRVDDQVLRISGVPVRNTAQLAELIGESPAGTRLNIEIARHGQRRALVAEVQRSDVMRVTSLASGAVVWRGLRFDNRTVESATISDENTAGLVIHDVIPNSPAGHAGLRSGDVVERIGKVELRDVEGFLRIVAEQRGAVVLRVRGRGEVRIGL